MKMRQDLIQGLLEYPVSEKQTAVEKTKKRRFFQIIPPSVVKGRLSRRTPTTRINPVIIHPDKRDDLWQNLRHRKNI